MPSDLPPVPDKATRDARKVRPVSRNPTTSRSVEKIRSLKCYQDVHQMIVTGWRLPEVAKFVQGTKKELTDVEELSLIGYLQTYRQSLPPAALLVNTMPPAFSKAAAAVRDGLDVIAELTQLYEIQMKRINIDFATEQRVNKLLPSMTQEIRCGREILESIQKTKMDLGLDERHLGTLAVQAVGEVNGRYGRESVRRVMENPASRQKLLSLAERFTAVVSERDKLVPVQIEQEVEQEQIPDDGDPDAVDNLALDADYTPEELEELSVDCPEERPSP